MCDAQLFPLSRVWCVPTPSLGDRIRVLNGVRWWNSIVYICLGVESVAFSFYASSRVRSNSFPRRQNAKKKKKSEMPSGIKSHLYLCIDEWIWMISFSKSADSNSILYWQTKQDMQSEGNKFWDSLLCLCNINSLCFLSARSIVSLERAQGWTDKTDVLYASVRLPSPFCLI